MPLEITHNESKEQLGDAILSKQEKQALQTIKDAVDKSQNKPRDKEALFQIITKEFTLQNPNINMEGQNIKQEAAEQRLQVETFWEFAMHDLVNEYRLNSTDDYDPAQHKEFLTLGNFLLKYGKSVSIESTNYVAIEESLKRWSGINLDNQMGRYLKYRNYSTEMSAAERAALPASEQDKRYMEEYESLDKSNRYEAREATVLTKTHEIGYYDLTIEDVQLIKDQLTTLQGNPNAKNIRISILGGASQLPISKERVQYLKDQGYDVDPDHPRDPKSNIALAQARADEAEKFIKANYPDLNVTIEAGSGVGNIPYNNEYENGGDLSKFYPDQFVKVSLKYEEKVPETFVKATAKISPEQVPDHFKRGNADLIYFNGQSYEELQISDRFPNRQPSFRPIATANYIDDGVWIAERDNATYLATQEFNPNKNAIDQRTPKIIIDQNAYNWLSKNLANKNVPDTYIAYIIGRFYEQMQKFYQDAAITEQVPDNAARETQRTPIVNKLQEKTVYSKEFLDSLPVFGS